MDPKGHQPIPIEPIHDKEALYATFSKRRKGLFKKASSFCSTFGADIGLFISTPANASHAFFSPNMESVMQRYHNPNAQPSPFELVDDIHARGSIKRVSDKYTEVRAQLAAELKRGERLDEEEKKARAEGKFKEFNVEQMDKEELAKMKAFFERIRAETAAQMERLKSGGGSCSMDEN